MPRFNATAYHLEAFLGSKKHPKPWMQPSPVITLPNLKERHAFTHFQIVQRYTYFTIAYVGITVATAMFLSLLTSISNAIAKRRIKQQGSQYILLEQAPCDGLKRDSLTIKDRMDARYNTNHKGGDGFRAPNKMLEHKSTFAVVDIFFTWYSATHHIFCGAMVAYSLIHDAIDVDFGMDFEIYVAWVTEAMLVHFLSVGVTIWFQFMRQKTDEDIPSPFGKVCSSCAPFLSERFNLLRDWVTIGIYITDGHPVADLCAAIVFMSLVVCVVILFSDPKLLQSMRLTYWPVAKHAMTLDDHAADWKPQVTELCQKLGVAVFSADRRTSEHCRRNEVSRRYTAMFARWQLKVLCEMDMMTQQHKVVNTLYGEIPQGVAAVLFVAFSKFSVFVAISLVMYVTKVVLLVFVRPYVLCFLADSHFPWQNLKASDLDEILKSRKRYNIFCPWERRILAALEVLQDLKEGPEVACAAIRGIGRLLNEVDDDASAEMVAHYINLLREMQVEMHDSKNLDEGVVAFKKTVVDTIMTLSDGIEERNVNAPAILSGGNLGYLPTGGDLKEFARIVSLMHAGEHDVRGLLSQGGADRLYQRPPQHDSHADLLLFFSDLEPDDVMAIAQLWQWKGETLRMATDPIVVYGADFADKEEGTVFEKKSLVTYLMLGIRRLHILTPDESWYETPQENKHPSAKHWEGNRRQELIEICDRIKRFKGDTIHFYIMAPAKGNIAAILEQLKSIGAWPSRHKWRIQIYSGSFNIRGMSVSDKNAIIEFGSRSDAPLLDAAKFPFFGGKDNHPWTASFTTFAPDKFPLELNLVAHPLVPAGLRLLNDEHNIGLLEPRKLYKKKPLTKREQQRLEALSHLYKIDTIQDYCKGIYDDFALYSKCEDFKKSTLVAFAFASCDSPLADQLIFMEEFLIKKFPSYLDKMEEGQWVVSDKGFTSVEAKEGTVPTCRAIQPVLAEPLNENHLSICRSKLQEYLLKHLQALVECDEHGDSSEHVASMDSTGARGVRMSR